MDIPKALDGFGEFIKTRAPWLSSAEVQESQTRGGNQYRGIGAVMARLKETRNRRCLLSLDGGGIRGFSQLLILEELAHRIMHDLGMHEPSPLCNYFDMIGGVGTGGYLAILTGRLGLTVPQMKEEFKQLIVCILKGDVSSDEFDAFLKAMVKRWTGDSETPMFDLNSPTSHCKTFVGAVTTRNVSYLTVFRSYETRELSLNVPIWQAARATLSHPDLFAQTRVESSSFEQIYMSGEMGWKNPSNECIREFEALWPSQDIASLVNIGSGHEGVVQIEGSPMSDLVANAMKRMVTDCEKVAQEVAYRFQGRNIYFRLSAEQGLQQKPHRQTLTLQEIEAHTRSYLKSPETKSALSQLVAAVLQVVEVSVWTTNRDRFESVMDELISECSKLVDDISVATVQLAAQETILLLETIRRVKSSEDHWLAFAKTIVHQAIDVHDNVKELQEPLSQNPLWVRIKSYFAEIKVVRQNLKQLLKLNPHRVWGPPTQDTFLAKATTNLDECFKRIPNAVLNNMWDHTVSAKRETQFNDLVSWISQLDMERRHQDILAMRAAGTGGWLMDTSQFKLWLDDQKQEGCRVLLGFGDPGAGKTFICCSAIEYIRAVISTRRSALVFIYCDYRDSDKQNPCSVVGELAKQLLLQAPFVPDEVWPVFRKHAAITTRKVQQIFSLLLHCFDSVYVCIDALDECQPQLREELISFFVALKRTSLRVFCTGRPNVTAEVTEFLGPLGVKSLEICAHEADIRPYVEERISRDRHKSAMDEQLLLQITKKLVSHRLFILVAFQLEFILHHITKRARKEALKNLPAELFGIYEATFARIREQPTAEISISALSWIYLAQQKLHLNEIQHALSTQPGDTTFDEDGIPSDDDLLDCCLGLVVIERETLTIRLAHFTLQEYLNKYWQQIFPLGHSAIASTCLTYLNFNNSFLELEEPGRHPRLLTYAARYLGIHMSHDTNNELDRRAMELITDNTKFPLLEERMMYDWDLYRKAEHISSPLHWAACCGVVSVTKLLLEQADNIHINAQNNEGKTALSLAAANNHDEVMKLLLGVEGIEADSKDYTGCTPLWYAAADSDETGVKLLLDVDGVEADSKDDNGRTPLSLAAAYGEDAVVKLLLSVPGVEADSRDNDGSTPLIYAAMSGREAGVKLLLGVNGVEADSRNDDGRTPLSYASENGNEAIVKLLLGVAGVEPNSRDNDGHTPLSYAAKRGQEAVANLLLATGGVEADSKDNGGRTPLSYAAEWSQGAVIKLLLDSNSVQLESQDRNKRTPLSWAAQHNHITFRGGDGAIETVKLLLDSYGADPNSKDIHGRAPLSYAAEYGRDETVRLLIERKVDIHQKDDTGKTAFSYAAQDGNGVYASMRPPKEYYERIRQILLDHGASDTRNPENSSADVS